MYTDWSKQNNMAAKINFVNLKKDISSSCEEVLQKTAPNLAEKILNEELQKYLNDIENHPISQELNQGPDGANTSNTLGGKENLFAFIGFDAAEKPVENLKKIISNNTFLNKKGKFNQKTFELEFDIFTPSLEEIKLETSLPFEEGRSWVKGVEDGISGFGYYVYGLLFPKSRSGRGIQSKNKIRSAIYKPVKYMSEIYANFISNLK